VNDCVNTDVRDALPDFVNNRLSEVDAATIKAHIESCVDCQVEVALLRDVRALQPIAPVMDVNRIAAALPAYRSVSTSASRNGSRKSWALAAAAAIVAIGGWAITTRSVSNESTPAVAVVAPADAPVTATASAKQTPTPMTPSKPSVTAAVKSGEMQVAALSLVGTTDDLSDADLETLVASLDGIDTVPSAEPASVTTTVDDIDGNDDH